MGGSLAVGAPVSLIVDRIRSHAARMPEALALRAPGGQRSYGALVARAEAIAARLRAEGCAPGDRIAIIGKPSIAWLDVMAGAMFARCAFAPLSTALTIAEQALLLQDARPALVFSAAAFSGACPWPKDRVVALERIDAWIAEGPAQGDPDRPEPDDLFSIIYSSGTTGIPKGIAHSGYRRAAFVAARPRAGVGHLTLLSTAPYTNFTFLGMIGPLFHGGAVSLLGKFDVVAFLDAVREQAVTDLALVPVQVRRILEHPAFDPAALAGLDFTMVSGSPLDPAMKARMAALWPGRIVDSYGTTETGGVATLDFKAYPDKLDTVGRLMPGVEIRVLDEAGCALAEGEAGEIVARTELPMDGYHAQAALTASSCWTDEAGRAFFRTGDVGRLGGDGFLRITGRAKDMIISGGLNLYACDIEAVIDSHPDVAESAVIAIPDARWGERPFALVVLRAGATLTAGAVMAWAETRVARTSRPVGVEIVAALPRNDMGKVLKRVLREPYWKDRAVAVA